MSYKDTLKEFLGEDCLFNEPMDVHTTYRTGGPAEVYVYPQTPEQWEFVLKLAHAENIPLRTVGFGSNILVSSRGVGGITCSTKKMNRIFRHPGQCGRSRLYERGRVRPRNC